MTRPERQPLTRVRGWITRWWGGDPSVRGRLLDRALVPAELLYRAAVRGRNAAFDRGWRRTTSAPIPVISVGNLAVGGAGKTPVAASIAAMLSQWDIRPAVVMRGYGGDEVLVHRELNPDVPVFVAALRRDGVAAAAAAGREVAVLDDAFQHRALARDLDLVLISAESGGRADRLLPRGPWREELSALRRADLVVVTRRSASPEQADAVAAALLQHVPEERVIGCAILPSELESLHGGATVGLEWLEGRSVLAVASLADPRPFEQNLLALGASVELLAFPDHHAFAPSEADLVVRRSAGRSIVMTRKEAVKLRPLLADSVPAWVLRQSVQYEPGRERLESALRAAIAR